MKEQISLIDEISSNIGTHLRAQRCGVSVLNSESPTDEANRLLVELGGGYASVERVAPSRFDPTEEMAGQSILVVGKVSHEVDGEVSEFDGWFVGEEYDGQPHPYLLLSPTQVYERGVKPARELQ